jgi:hypothetical protein
MVIDLEHCPSNCPPILSNSGSPTPDTPPATTQTTASPDRPVASGVEAYANNPIESDHGRLKHRLRAMRGLRTDRTAQTIITAHAFVQNLRRGHYELGRDAPPALRVAAAFTELAQAI